MYTDTQARALRAAIDRAVALIGQDNVAQASALLLRAQETLGEPHSSSDHGLAGALQLCLAAAHLAAGDNAGALRSATKAEEEFAEASDVFGRAQALHNKGIVLKRMRESTQATEAFAAAKNAYAKVVPPLRATRPSVGSSLTTPSARFANDAQAVEFLGEPSSELLSIRWPGTGGGVGGIRVPQRLSVIPSDASWSLGVLLGDKAVQLNWRNGVRPSVQEFERAFYLPRTKATTRSALSLKATSAPQLSVSFVHLYHFGLPVRIGDALRLAGSFESATTWYQLCLEYTYLNVHIEGPALWGRMARNFVSQAKNSGTPDARNALLEQVVKKDGTVLSTSVLYSAPGFVEAQQTARGYAEALGAGASVELDPVIGGPMLEAWLEWQVEGGPTAEPPPVFTYDYLREVALQFAAQAIRSEREYVNFAARAEEESAQRDQLAALKVLAEIDLLAAQVLEAAAQQDYNASLSAKQEAAKRLLNAQTAKSEYGNVAFWKYKSEAIATLHMAGQSFRGGVIQNVMADMSDGTWSLDTWGATWQEGAAAARYYSGELTREYELNRMQDSIDELTEAKQAAQYRTTAADYRKQFAAYQVQAASLRRDHAEDALTAFDAETFTPALWADMSEVMLSIANSFKARAIDAARLMQRAYNFQMDTGYQVIADAYPATSSEGLLGADLLVDDIESFTHHYITDQTQKESQIKDTLSLASEYPMHLHSFRRTGVLEFETSLADFDRRHGGFFRQTLHSVEVELVGILPPGGVNGTLSAGVFSRYRTVANGGAPGSKSRVHDRDTIALSEYEVRRDSILFRFNDRKLGHFEGQGVASSWRLELPKRSNALDYDLIFDIRLHLYYTALYSGELAAFIAAQEPLLFERARSRELLVRNVFPVAWYTFQEGGDLVFEIQSGQLPPNETNFTIDKLSILVLAAKGVSPGSIGGCRCTLTLPGKPGKEVLLNGAGEVVDMPGNNFDGVCGGSLLGPTRIELQPNPGTDLADAEGGLRADRIEQIALIIEYHFDWKS